MTSASDASRPGTTGLAGRIDLARAGRRVDLVVDGVPYSTFHPDRPWSGYVWDALAAAVLLRAPADPTVLLLGGGGGTVLLLLRRLRPDARLVAVELDPRVVELARARFDLDRIGVEMITGDGIELVRTTKRKFDLVLDDMFAPRPGGLGRPVEDEEAHLRRIAARLTPSGVAATNSTTDDDPPGLEKRLRAAHAAVFGHVATLRPRLGWNIVVAGSHAPFSALELRRRREALASADRAGVAGVRFRCV